MAVSIARRENKNAKIDILSQLPATRMDLSSSPMVSDMMCVHCIK